MTPAQNSIIKVSVNFASVVVAFWVADFSMTAYKNWQATRQASKSSAPAPAPATAGKA